MSALYKQLSDMQVLESMEDNAAYAALSNEDLSTLLSVYVAESVGEDGVSEILEEMDSMTMMEAANVNGYDEVMERTIVKLDKRAKKNQAYKTAIYIVARNENDAEYKRLVTLWQMEKYLTRKLEKKYGTKAKAYMKEMKRQAKAKSVKQKLKDHPIIKKMTNAFTRSEKETQTAKHLGAAPKGVLNKGKNVMSQLGSKIGH
ncbi:MAG: hypothetical protein NC548_29690 [Lachnospiraceae bacterium]|nr:hypothetical protein [Lachnospiraceae bacterium]